ncbi:RNA polymerase sigma factor [Nonomuraea longispora]|uniref:RNA polymerase sigma factor n=1 Tax=Nonomuraea longispora TaxID=1848320 RepID=A0A4R4MWG3_9ACTN|nr:RNA polymerase sigma factor [Nonomuraea longispora]TDB99693.1 RNA polymerase sigma factor [Nonomuraea longispora]
MRHESRAPASPGPGAMEAGRDAPAGAISRHESERFAALFTRHAPELRRYVIRRLGLEPADDIVAETFAVALQHLASYDATRGDERAWLYGIATNLVGRHRRREIGLYKALSRTGADAVIEPFTDEVDRRVSADGVSRQLARALSGLSRRHLDTLLLVTWADLTYEQAAAALGVPVGTVRSRVSRARNKLRRVLGGVDPAAVEEERRR